MIEFKRYPHVGEILKYYAGSLQNEEAINILKNGVESKEDAYALCRFVISVVDGMASDMQENNSVLGSVDNTNMIPDIDYEISLYLANIGLEDVWDQVCNEE